MKFKILILIIVLYMDKSVLKSQILLEIPLPDNTAIIEIDPVFTCANPYENVPIARANGKTWRFENNSWPNNLFWGPTDVITSLLGVFPATCDSEKMINVNLDPISSDLVNGIAVFTGITSYPAINTTNVRLTLIFRSYPDSIAINLTEAYEGYILIPVNGNFEMNALIEAQVDGTDGVISRNSDDVCLPMGNVAAGWYPALDLFDQIGCNLTSGVCKNATQIICTSFDTPGFFELCTDSDLPNLTAVYDTICPGTVADIQIEGSLNSAKYWIIFDSGCGSDSIGMTSSNSFTTSELSTSDTFYVRGAGGCISPGNCDSIIITVLDTMRPEIILLGDNPFTVSCEGSFEDPGATASDECNGDLSAMIKVDGMIDDQIPDIYWLIYSVMDVSGNTDTVYRSVIVQNPIECAVCKDTLYIPASYLLDDPHLNDFHAALFLKSDGTITDGENIVFKSGQDIELLENFTVEAGATINLFMETCSELLNNKLEKELLIRVNSIKQMQVIK